MKTGAELIAEERARQINVEGWSAEHDDQHTNGELADAAACYAMTDEMKDVIDEEWGFEQWLKFWPFELSWLKFTEDRVKDLTKAGAMIAAEIDRLNRLKS